MLVKEVLFDVFYRLKKSSSYYGHGTNNAWDEANWLVSAIVKRENLNIKKILNKKIQKNLLRKIRTILDNRLTYKIPLSYLLYESYFAGIKFYINKNVIIPRSPFAEIIKNKLLPWIKIENAKFILDIFTGSGCIAIALAYYYPHLKIFASDISFSALKIAKKNARHYSLEKKINFIQSDIFKNIYQNNFDIIFANPPYIDEKKLHKLPKEYSYEPIISLKAKMGGLFYIKEILMKSKKYLSENGILLVEVGDHQKKIMKMYPNIPFIWLTLYCGGQGIFMLYKNDLKNLF